MIFIDKNRKIFSSDSLVFVDMMAIVTVIVDFFGINIYFWGISFKPISLYNVVGEWAIWWIYARFVYFKFKKLK